MNWITYSQHNHNHFFMLIFQAQTAVRIQHLRMEECAKWPAGTSMKCLKCGLLGSVCWYNPRLYKQSTWLQADIKAQSWAKLPGCVIDWIHLCIILFCLNQTIKVPQYFLMNTRHEGEFKCNCLVTNPNILCIICNSSEDNDGCTHYIV